MEKLCDDATCKGHSLVETQCGLHNPVDLLELNEHSPAQVQTFYSSTTSHHTVTSTFKNSVLAAQLTLDHLKCFVIDGDDHDHPLSAADGQVRFQHDFGMDVRLPETTPGGRARLVSVRQCLYGDGWIAHALYRVDGQPVSLFVIDGSHDAASVAAFGRQAKVVERHGRTFVVVAPAGLAQVAGALGLEAE